MNEKLISKNHSLTCFGKPQNPLKKSLSIIGKVSYEFKRIHSHAGPTRLELWLRPGDEFNVK
jgi:hypothetical protein